MLGRATLDSAVRARASFYVADALTTTFLFAAEFHHGTSRNCNLDGQNSQEQQEKRIAPPKLPHSLPSWRHSSTVHTEPGTFHQPHSDAPSRCPEGKSPTSPGFHSRYSTSVLRTPIVQPGSVLKWEPTFHDSRPGWLTVFDKFSCLYARLCLSHIYPPSIIQWLQVASTSRQLPLCANDESIKRSVPG